MNNNIKYINFTSKGITVKIDHKDFNYTREFYFRKNGGYHSTLKKAILDRDEVFFNKYGYQVSNRFFHSKKKEVTKNSLSHDLPPGLSYGYSRGKLLYIVVSWSPTKNKVSRKRFNINKLGIDEAILSAIKFRSVAINSLSK